MTDFSILYHIASGIIVAFLVIVIMALIDKQYEFISVAVLAVAAGFVANLLKEIIVDLYGWLPCWVGRFDLVDVAYGTAGSGAMVFAYFIHKFQKGEL